MWYKAITVLFSLSWNLTYYVIQGINYFIFPILKPSRICDTSYYLLEFPYLETFQDMWYQVLTISFSLSWHITGYMIQVLNIVFPYRETLQDMWYKVLTILFSPSWSLTGYVIQGTNYLIYPIMKPYRICDTMC
jgi:hypothetical protein